jgi:hypothetical protein
MSSRIPVLEPVKLERWAFVYSHEAYSDAELCTKLLFSTCKEWNMQVEEPTWVEVRAGGRPQAKDVVAQFDLVMGEIERPQIIFILHSFKSEAFYEGVKKGIQMKYGIPTQVCYKNNLKKGKNLAANLLKQMNVKLRGDLYHISMPPSLSAYKRPMMVGIDVCHEKAMSVVGFTSSTDKNFCKYYHEVALQTRRKEIIDNRPLKEESKGGEEGRRTVLNTIVDNGKLHKMFSNSLSNFNTLNKAYPDLIMLFRDGVGDSQRAEAMKSEFSQIQSAIAQVKDNYDPALVICFVNKRIDQRFFASDKGQIFNPP